MSRRTEKVAALMQREIGEYLLTLELPSLTTISKVEVTPDLKWCKTWVTILDSPQNQLETLKIMNAARRDLQEQLIKKMPMKIVPRVSFVHDHGEEYAAKINELLKETHESS